MTASDVSSVLAILVAAYPNAEIGEETLVVYEAMLADVDAKALQVVVLQHIATSKWFPTVAELREAVAEDAMNLPSPADALAQVQAAIHAKENGSMHGLVYEAMQRCGGSWEAKRSTTPQQWRRQFLEVYRELRAQTITEANTQGVKDNLLTDNNPQFRLERTSHA